MLNIYGSREDVKHKDIIDLNDDYFISISLMDDEFTKTVLNEIDDAEYYDETSILSRRKGVKCLYKDTLSTGAKTLLNIYYNPDVCFNICECGHNAIRLLPMVEDGNILWEYPVTYGLGYTEKCSVSFQGRLYTNWAELLEHLRDYAYKKYYC